MDSRERLQHELHAKTKGFQAKVDRAHEVLRAAFALDRHPFYCAFSGGIDSTVLLHLLAQYPWQVPVRWSDDGFDFPETIQFLAESEARYGFRLHRTRNFSAWQAWCVEMGRPDLCYDPEAVAAWGNPHRWDDERYTPMHQEQHMGYGGVFLGLLASESNARLYTLKGGARPLYQVKSEGGMWHCSPLASWTKRDVWGYIVSRDVPYNPVYDRLATLGVPLDKRRVAPLTCFRTLQFGSASVLKSGWPEVYNRLAATFPLVRSY